jgi:hypothetical protein
MDIVHYPLNSSTILLYINGQVYGAQVRHVFHHAQACFDHFINKSHQCHHWIKWDVMWHIDPMVRLIDLMVKTNLCMAKDLSHLYILDKTYINCSNICLNISKGIYNPLCFITESMQKISVHNFLDHNNLIFVELCFSIFRWPYLLLCFFYGLNTLRYHIRLGNLLHCCCSSC